MVEAGNQEMHQRRFCNPALHLYALVVCLSIALPAAAQSAGSPSSAEELFKTGVALAQQGKFAEAVASFRSSYSLDRARGTLQGLAMAEEAAALTASAYGHYRELLEESLAAADQARERVAREGIARLHTKVPKLVLVVRQPVPQGLEIKLDEQVVPAWALGSELPLDPGTHTLRAQAPHFQPFTRTWQTTEASKERLEILLRPPPPVIPSAPPPQVSAERNTTTITPLRTVGLAVGGVGLVALGVGSYFWIRSDQTYHDVDTACPTRQCTSETLNKAEEGKRQETLGVTGIVLGSLGLAAGITLFVVGSPKRASGSAVQVQVGPGAVSLRGSL